VRRPPTIVLGIAVVAVALCATAAPPAPGAVDGEELWYLACAGRGGGDGSLADPFRRAEDAILHAAAGDSIVVLPIDDPSPECVVELAPGQRLVGADATPRPRVARVVTAADTVVADLEIVGSEREAIAVTGGEVTIQDVAIREAAVGVLVVGGDVTLVMERVTIDGATTGAVHVLAGGRGTLEVSLRRCAVTGSSNEGLELVVHDDATVVMEVVGSRFENIAGPACQLAIQGEASVDATIESVEMSGVGFGVVGFVEADSALDLEIHDLVAIGVEATGVNLVLGSDSTSKARVNADITGGRIAKSGGSGHGVRLTASGSGTMTARVEDTTVDGGVDFDRGISAEAREGDGRLDVAIVGNRVEVGPAALEGILVRARDGTTVCAELHDNVVDGGSVGIAVEQRDGGRIAMAADRNGDVDASTIERVLRAANRAATVVVTAEEPVRLVTACGREPRADGG